MTRKGLIESLKQNMPEGLTDLEKTRYIYIELGKQRNFDSRYFYGNTQTRKKMYRLAEEAKENPHKFYERKTLICVSLSYLYQSILKEFGIDCSVVLDEGYDDGHLMPILRIEDRNQEGESIRIKADLQMDLEKIQAGMQTKEFGTCPNGYSYYYEIDEKELKQIDKKIGYIKDDYKDIDIEEMITDIEKMSASDSLRFILQDTRTYRGINLQGPIERRKYFGEILNRLVGRYMNKKIYMFTCYRQREDEKKDYTLCVYSYDKEELMPYLYSEKEGKFVQVSLQKLAELQKNGLILGTRPHTNGVQLLKRIIQKNVRKTIDKAR